jgi:hypothetical protein
MKVSMAMPMSILTLGDASLGRSLQDWGDAFVYAMGPDFDFDNAIPSKPHVVLNIICLPPTFTPISNDVALKRRNSEIWSTYNADYARFFTSAAAHKVAAIKSALIGAVQQIPDKIMPLETKATFVAAAERGGARLIAEPRHHPRRA